MDESDCYQLSNALQDLYTDLSGGEILLASDIRRNLVDRLLSTTLLPEIRDVAATQVSSIHLIDEYYLPVLVLCNVPLLSGLERRRIEFYRDRLLCSLQPLLCLWTHLVWSPGRLPDDLDFRFFHAWDLLDLCLNLMH